jgi:hypothetical protein
MFRLKRWLLLHEVASSFFCIATIVHWNYSDKGNNLLHISLVLILWLTAAGGVLRYRMAQNRVRRGIQLIHTQRFLFLVLLLLLLIGHLAADYR